MKMTIVLEMPSVGLAIKSVLPMLCNLMRQSCENVYVLEMPSVGSSSRWQLSLFSLQHNLMRQSCEDFYCARDAKRGINFTISVLPAMQSRETVL